MFLYIVVCRKACSMVQLTVLINESELANKHEVRRSHLTAPYYTQRKNITLVFNIMNTDDLREQFFKEHPNSKMDKCIMPEDVGYDYFTDDYVLWLEEKLILYNVVVPKGTCCLNPQRINHVTIDGITHSTCENCKEEIV